MVKVIYLVSDVNLATVSGVKRATGLHHGNLRSALLDVAYQLVDEHGVTGWTMTEASRRAGVSVAAPYKHFSDRDDLLASLAARGFDRLASDLASSLADATDNLECLTGFARAYLAFAWLDRPHFDAAFGVPRNKAAYPELVQASAAIFDLLQQPARELTDHRSAPRLAFAVGSLAHGYASMLRLDAFTADRDPLTAAQHEATGSVEALVRGFRNH